MKLQRSSVLSTLLLVVALLPSFANGSRGSPLRRRQQQQPPLEYVGAFPLQMCEGDCDEDADCDDGLACYLRDPNEDVPGCSGGEQDDSRYDYCVAGEPGEPSPAPSRVPSIAPTNYPRIEVVRMEGKNATNAADPYSVVAPLDQCQGLCHQDDDCAEGLICWGHSLGEEVPYCVFEEADVSISKQSPLDYLNASFCTRPPPGHPSVQQQIPVPAPPGPPPALAMLVSDEIDDDDNRPSLHRCQGDCNDDEDCVGDNLICYRRYSRGNDAAPGCYFDTSQSKGMSESSNYDVCIDRASVANYTRLRLYWQEGYYWQEEAEESFWCMHPATPNSDEAVMGLGVIILPCSQSSRQIFEMVYQPSGKALIRSVYYNECLKGGGIPWFVECNPNDAEQLWIPMNGGWGSPSFEITREGRPNQCLSQHHHPRRKETVSMRDCEQERADTASAWEFYW